MPTLEEVVRDRRKVKQKVAVPKTGGGTDILNIEVVPATETVRSLRIKIANATGIAKHRLILTYNGQTMIDLNRLHFYGIKGGDAAVQVMVRHAAFAEKKWENENPE